MEFYELLIQTEHPPHSLTHKKRGKLLRAPNWVKIETITYGNAEAKKSFTFFNIFLKFFLFIVIFILSFHLPFPPGIKYLPPGLQYLSVEVQDRQQTIREILDVLDRHATGLANVTKEELAEVIYEESIRYNHEPKFILALIAIESSFQNWSVSEQGAKGLMQIMPYVAESIAQELGIEWSGDRTLFNPYLNIKMGIHYLSQLILDFEDIGIALTAYNYGPTYVKGLIERKERIPPNYYRKFLTVYQNI